MSQRGTDPSQWSRGYPGHNQDVPLAESPKHVPDDPLMCVTCKGDKEGRNLVVCFDGTSNQYGDHNTNVIENYFRLVKDDQQLTYYNSGIGTFAWHSGKSPEYAYQSILNTLDLAFALRFEKIIVGGYRWLSNNYRPGDRIYLLGFSRGAYQVRALAAMIEKVGLLFPGNEEQIPFAYDLYYNADKNDQTLMEFFRKTFSRLDVGVHFVGAWDSVSSVGAVRGNVMPGTNKKPKGVCYFRHALALDERRVKFEPEFVCGGAGYEDPDTSPGSPGSPGFPGSPGSKSNVADSPNSLPPVADLPNVQQTVARPHIKEVWFAGCHSDIGGGSRGNNGKGDKQPRSVDASAIPFLWLASEGAIMGLRHLEVQQWRVHPDLEDLKLVKPSESMGGFWRLFELFPIKRLTYEDSEKVSRVPHFFRGRKIVKGQKIHVSVALIENYKPKAKFHPDTNMSWDNILERGRNNDLEGLKNIPILELDTFHILGIDRWLRQFIDNPNHEGSINYLKLLVSTREGAKAILKHNKASDFLIKVVKNQSDFSFEMITKLVTHDTDYSIIVHRDFIDEIASERTVQGSNNMHAKLLQDLANHYGELPLPFLELTSASSRWFRQICVATLRFALYLRSRDPQDLDKAHDLLHHAQIPIHEQSNGAPTRYEAAVLNCQATTLEAFGVIEKTIEAVKKRTTLQGQIPGSYTPDLASSILTLSALLLHDRGGKKPGYAADVLTKSRHASLESQVPILFSNLSNRLHDLGLISEALSLAEESVSQFLSKGQPSSAASRATFAGALNNLSNRLEDSGRYEEAINRIEEAVRHYREAVASHITPQHSEGTPNPYLPHLVVSLTNLSHHHLQFGDQQQAFVAIEEAVRICRKLSAESEKTAEFHDQLSSSLLVLSLNHSSSGLLEDALEASREAVRLRRVLVSIDPDTYTPDLALSLTRLSTDLAALGQLEGALTEIKEAVRLFRELALRRIAFIPSLAKCVGDLSDRFADIGLREDALTAARESVHLHEVELQVSSGNPALTDPVSVHPALAQSPSSHSHSQSRSQSQSQSQIDEDPFNRQLHGEAIAVIRKSIPVLLQRELQVADERAVHTADLAVSLYDLSNRLSYCGRHQEALVAIDRAIFLQRGLQLGGIQTDTATAELAMSLRCRSDRLGELGRRDEALAQIREATDMYHTLSQKRLGPFTAEYATCLQSFSDRLFGVKQFSEAQKKMEDALESYRLLANKWPDAYFPGVAATLRHLAELFAELGEHLKAYRAIKESVDIYQRLANMRRDAFVPEVALSLRSLSCRLSDLGLYRDALLIIRASVHWYRILADERRAVFTPDLSLSLRILSDRLFDLNSHEEALGAIRESVSLHERLARDQPDAYNPELAISLRTLSNRLSDLRQRDEALSSIRKSCKVLRKLASASPALFNPQLAISLRVLSHRHSDQKQLPDALVAIRESVSLYEDLAKTDHGIYDTDVAVSLRFLSNQLQENGLRDEALTTIQKSVSLFGQLEGDMRRRNETIPEIVISERAASLVCLSNRQSGRKVHQEAVVAIKGALELYQGLSEGDLKDFQSDLSRPSFYALWSLLRLGPEPEGLVEARKLFEVFKNGVQLTDPKGEDKWVMEDMEEASRLLVSLERKNAPT